MIKAAAGFKLPDSGVKRCFDDACREIETPRPGEPFYGQNGCYEANPLSFTKLGADGAELPAGAQWADGLRMVRDNNTGLVWEVKSPAAGDLNYADDRYTWQDAQDVYAAKLNERKYGGFSDWRVPYKDELRSIVDYGRSGPAADTSYFQDCRSDFYWTNAEYRMHPTLAWGIVFGLGSAIVHGKKMARHVRAVRGGASRAFGPADASRFKDNGDGTVTDPLTGLMWQQGENERMGWYAAMKKCQELDLGGHKDWRLPNIKELNTILNLDYTEGWWYYKNVFPAAGLKPPLLHYFSSTPHEQYYVWVTNFCFGYDGYYAGKNAPLLFRAVRSAAPAQMEKPEFRLPETGQRAFFDDDGNPIPAGAKGSRFYGQDGSLVTAPLKYSKLGEGEKPLPAEAGWADGLRMVRDENTGLVWEAKSPAPDGFNYKDDRYDRAGAEDKFIAEMNRKGYGGFSDWRLPNREELRGIADYGGNAPAVDVKFFPDCAAEFYWAKDPNGFDPKLNWGIYFAYGCAISYPKTNNYRVRAVRGGYCRAFGDTARYAFKDNADGTVTDFNTGLMWKKDESPELTVEEALKYCETLSLAGHADWRLPNMKELATLIDPAYRDKAWFRKEFFPGVITAPLGFYQSSSVYGGTFGWGVNFQFGYDGYYADRKAGRYPFRPVRNVKQ